MLPLSQNLSLVIIWASEFDYETTFTQLMLLYNKTKPEKRAIGRWKVTNGFIFFFRVFFNKHLDTPAKAIWSRITDISSFTNDQLQIFD